MLAAIRFTAACRSRASGPPPMRIRIAAMNYALGIALARIYNQKVPAVAASATAPETSQFKASSKEESWAA